MRVIAVDPGLTIGLAWYDSETEGWEVAQMGGVQNAAEWIEERVYHLDVILVENYLSAGALTKEAMITIKLVGFFEHWAQYMDWGLALVPPQKRLSGVGRATTLIGDSAKDMHRGGRDAIAALAHAIVYTRTAS
jgi:hypothetical protein